MPRAGAPHSRDLVGARRPRVLFAERLGTQHAVARQKTQVHRRRAGAQRRPVGRYVREEIIGRSEQAQWIGKRVARPKGREADAAVAGDHRRDPLGDLEGHVRRFENRAVVVGVDIDEAGCDGQAAGLDHRVRRPTRKRAHRRDAVAFDRHVGLDGYGAGAVDHQAVADQQMAAAGPSSRVRRCVIPFSHSLAPPELAAFGR